MVVNPQTPPKLNVVQWLPQKNGGRALGQYQSWFIKREARESHFWNLPRGTDGSWTLQSDNLGFGVRLDFKSLLW